MSSVSGPSGYVLVQASGASLRDAQVQLGHSKMSTRLEVYTLPIPAHLRKTVQNLSRRVTSSSHPRKTELPVFGSNSEPVPEMYANHFRWREAKHEQFPSWGHPGQ